ncbi:MAG: YtxH domain-containing protein [Eggerthellaceae bacterium]|nr:YtxH domain-containing protein [Eggerthellaceae bacterium]
MGKLSSFMTGAAIGIAAALLLAPRTGEQTRALVAEKANAVTGEAKDFGAGFPASAQDAIKSAQEKAASLTKGAAPAAPAATVADDELREKIEAARKRIAAQVAANAEASKAAAEKVEEVAAEA